MRYLGRKMIAGTALLVGIAGAAAPAALADTGSTSPSSSAPTGATTLAEIKAKSASAISIRQSALQSAITDVTANRYLTTGDRSAVLAILNSDVTGLTALAPVIQADTTVAKAAADYKSIFTQYRVFALALPQARLAASADDLTGTVLPRLTDAQSKLQALLAGPDSGKNTPQVRAAMADLGEQITAITSETSGVAATVLGYTPAQWNANPSILDPSRSSLVTARGDSRVAHDDIATVVAALK